jgi:uncharacterized membrane-anchored protein YhcB (DUF1043 family)
MDGTLMAKVTDLVVHIMIGIVAISASNMAIRTQSKVNTWTDINNKIFTGLAAELGNVQRQVSELRAEVARLEAEKEGGEKTE